MASVEEVQSAIVQRVKAAFGSGSKVEEGWPQLYLQNNRDWPLITIAPMVDTSKQVGVAAHTTMVWDIRLLLPATPQVVTALLSHRKTMRKKLLGQDPTYACLLQQPAQEIESVEYHEPLPNQPFAGFTLLMQTQFIER